MESERDYVLGTHDAEIERLGLQHRVWLPQASRAWQRAGFTAGQQLVDLGCGPGYAALDLAGIAGPAGSVVAVDRSARFLAHLATQAAARGLHNVHGHELDLDRDPLPVTGADGMWVRWVFSFVSRPRELLLRAAGALRPGGTIVLHEYVDYRAWRLSPRSEAFESFVSEVMASWRESGGEPDIALELPRWLGELGFEVLEMRLLARVARPSDFTWQWPRTFLNVGIERLLELGRIDAAAAEAMRAGFDAAETAPGAFLVAPTVLEIIARKRQGRRRAG